MIKHIVLWKLKATAEGLSREQNAAAMKRDLLALKTKIPQIRHIEVGMNFVASDAAYDVALYSEFASEQDLNIYQQHPEHLKVAGFVARVRESRVVVDYKTE
ncbi:MAG: stress responsive protein [Nitrospirae bacterium GWD2_57_9]|nr:MAG: stress responsive protein [Nitrospirae bacterium GWD2_57_9]OGW49434.1 MAG: stress responsive protein [Nitrospirae bacterium GWC2_57_9]